MGKEPEISDRREHRQTGVVILPGIGLDFLPFGLTPSEVIERLGEADKHYTTEFDNKRAQYFARKLELQFEPECDDRLSWIEVHDHGATIFGISPWGMSKSELLELFGRELREEPEHEDYGSFESFLYPESWVELQIEFGCLRTIHFGHMFDDQDQPIWPGIA